MRLIALIMVATLTVTLTGCASQRDGGNYDVAATPAISAYHLHDYAGSMVMQLLQSAPVELRSGRVIVGHFSVTEGDGPNSSADLTPQLAKQLQHSMQTLLTQAGFQVVALDGNRTLVLDRDQNVALGKVDQPPATINVDYILNGSVTLQQHAYLVNTRLVAIASQHIAAAATAEIPKNVFWSRDKVQMRNGRLYRAELEGASK